MCWRKKVRAAVESPPSNSAVVQVGSLLDRVEYTLFIDFIRPEPERVTDERHKMTFNEFIELKDRFTPEEWRSYMETVKRGLHEKHGYEGWER